VAVRLPAGRVGVAPTRPLARRHRTWRQAMDAYKSVVVEKSSFPLHSNLLQSCSIQRFELEYFVYQGILGMVSHLFVLYIGL
jgi:hypothetical protein